MSGGISKDLPIVPGEEYELTDHHTVSEAGPSKPRQNSRSIKSPIHSRTLTLNPTHSSHHLLYDDQPAPRPSRRRRASSAANNSLLSPVTPRRQFLFEDGTDGGARHREEEVQLPDFGQMLGFNPDVDDHFAIAQGMRTRWKRQLYLLMEEPNSGREAFFIHVAVTGAILFSAVLTTLSTLPSFHADPSHVRALFGLDTTLVLLFTIEYISRSLAHSDSLHQYYTWSTSFFAILDLIAILPYYVEVARNQDTSSLFRFSILRTFRLLRVFRAFKYQNQMLLTIEVMYVAVQRSKDALVALSFFILLVLVFFSTLIYFAERGTWDANLGAFVDVDGDPSVFDSIPQTAWFALVTMSTVGYGDVIPRSSLGKLLTVPLLMFGLLLIALPSFVLGRNFAIVFDAMNKQAPQASSVVNSARASLERAPSPSLGPNFATPLLPTSTGDPLFALPGSLPMSTTGSAQRGVGAPLPRMWEGGEAVAAGDARSKERDLTNVKLAKNQVVLLDQIDSLRKTIDKQGEMLTQLMTTMGEKWGLRHGIPNGGETKGKRRNGSDEELQFALGSDGDG